MRMKLALFTVVCVIAMSACALYAAEGEKTAAVVYFSPTGTTKAVAERIAAAAGADIYEIVPKDKYTDADLNYRDENCRANREMKDASARPAIAGDLSAVSDHDVIMIGYPIWWGTAPRVISTFLDAYDLKGAEIYLFCTSGGSDVGTSESDIKSAYPSLDIKGSRRLNGASASDIASWLESIGVKKGE